MPPAQADAAMSERQEQAFVEALKPRGPGKPVVAVLALNEGTGITERYGAARREWVRMEMEYAAAASACALLNKSTASMSKLTGERQAAQRPPQRVRG
jgi:hypothetical protein